MPTSTERLLGASVTARKQPRRTAMFASAIALATLLAVPGAVQAQDPKAAPPAPAATADLSAELKKPGSVEDLVLGKADAPVTIHEYASLTCSHCAAFHTKVLPVLKTKYIDTGKVRLVLREFPLDNLAAAGSMLARCAGGEKTYAMIQALFEKQSEWAFVQGNPVPAMFKIAEGHGFTKETFDKCLTDQKLLDGITGVRDHANKTLGVRSTPTFFVNGKKMTERADEISGFDKVLEPLLK